MSVEYSDEYRQVMIQAHEDIRKRPGACQQGLALLNERFSVERVRREIWDETRKHRLPLDRISQRKLSRDRFRELPPQEQTASGYKQLLRQARGERCPAAYSPGARMIRAMQWLMAQQDGTQGEARAQATLILATLLWDKEADQESELLRLFGDWGAPFDSILPHSMGRWVATYLLANKDFLTKWSQRVIEAWKHWIEPEAKLGTPQLSAVAATADHNNTSAAALKMRRPAMNSKERNRLAWDYLQGCLNGTEEMTAKELAGKLGCSPATAIKTPAWQEYQKQKRARAGGGKRKIVSLDSGLGRMIGTEDESTELDQLIAEQRADYEPPATDPNPRHRPVKIYR